MPTDRISIARKWHGQGRHYLDTGDVFSAYFAGYISLAILAAEHEARVPAVGSGTSRYDDSTEAASIRRMLRHHREAVGRLIIGPPIHSAAAGLRRRTPNNSATYPITDPHDDSLLESAVQFLDRVWVETRTAPLSDPETKNHADYVARLLAAVRNRLFHGEKSYDRDGSDADLLSHLSPLLLDVVEMLVWKF